ncbi:MAG: sn-glycerol-3-phosphate ABC transporter ATP-binding protein UgpC [Capsulimonadaceae bacterium]|nr:sn-glycerol-3-phosphate ABC transporter ATP-binding protein UgpC [Capsulimonadaceae bacterium]
MSSVKLEQVYKRYGNVTAVKDLSLEIRDREFMVLVGPSGCGKTTALRMIAGLEEITEGRVRIGEKVVNDIEPRDRDIAMVFQNYALYPHMSVYENMAFGLKLRKMSKAEIEKRVGEAAAQLGITEYLKRKPRELSGGQRQRVALGRAIVREPQVFLMDEPLSNLDAKLRVQTRAELIKLHRRLGITTIYVTHDQVEAMTMGDRMAVMKDGVLQQCDTPMEVYHHPANIFVAGFIGTPSMNFVKAVVADSLDGDLIIDAGSFHFDILESEKKALAEWKGKNVVLGIRPADIYDKNLRNPVDAGPRNTLTAFVDVVEPMGDLCTAYLKIGDVDIVAMLDGATGAKSGEKLQVVVDVSRSHLFDPETEKAIY